MSDETKQHVLPPGMERLDRAPEYDADVDPRLLKQIDDPADRYQVEAMSVMRQDVRWLKQHMIIAYNMALDSYGVRVRLDQMEQFNKTRMAEIEALQKKHTERFDGYRNAPLKAVYWVIGIAAHTTVTVLLTVWVTKLISAGAPVP